MQSKILKVLTVGAVSMCAVCSAACVAYAEGSKDLVESNNGYRPYLEWNSKTNLEMKRENVIYVYAKEGETIYFGSSENANNADTIQAIGGNGDVDTGWYNGTNTVGIAVTLPSDDNTAVVPGANTGYELVESGGITINANKNKVYLFKVDKSENGVGYISSVAQESAGPNVGSVSDGYNPLSFTAPYTGTYSFRFLSSRHDATSDPTPVLTNGSWNSNGGTVAAFDVTVYNKDNELQSGRVWADRLFLNSGSWNVDDGIYSKYYVLTDDAFAYEVDLNGMSSWGFVLYSNKRGFLWDPENAYTKDNSMTSNLQSLNRSFYSAQGNADVGEPPVFNNGQIYANYTPLTDDDKTHKLFFNNPSNNIDVLKAYTGNTALAGAEGNPISKYEGSVGKSFTDGRDGGNNNDLADGTGNNPFKSTIGYGGTFTVTLSKESAPETLSLMLDFSGYKLTNAGEHGGLTAANNVPELDENDTWAKLGYGETSAESEQNVVTLTATNDGSGGFKFTWSGLDAYGNVVPAGTYTNSVSLYAAYGVAHFPMIDIENSPNGVQIEMLNEITLSDFEEGKDKYTVYYNNSKFSELFNPNTAFSSKSLGDNKNAANGISSEITSGKSKALQFTDESGDQTALDIWKDLYDQIGDTLTIEVTAHPVLYPILSYVAEGSAQGVPATNAETGYDGTLDSSTKSHVWYNNSSDSKPQTTNAVGGIYGNTISTGFAAYLQNVSAYSVRNNILWTVTIPNPNNTGKLYVKDYDGATEISDSVGNKVSVYDLTLSAAFTDTPADAVIDDTDSATILNGSIKQINSFSDTEAGDIINATMELYDNQGTVITGRGTVLYGLVIDRIYAPDATATVEYVHGWDDSAGWTDITDSSDATNPVHSVDADGYATSTDNIYHNLLQAQLQSEE